MKNIHDISVDISTQSVIWPGDPAIHLDRVEDMMKGKKYNLTHLSMSLHNGSHIDAPLHFVRDGKSIEMIPLDTLIGPCYVLEIGDNVDLINASVLKSVSIPEHTTRLLLKTKNSNYWKERGDKFHKEYCGITTDGAKFLVGMGLKLIGIDYLSISPFSDLDNPHIELLNHDIVILETINLDGIHSGWYDLVCLPLKLVGVEGAPVRAILFN